MYGGRTSGLPAQFDVHNIALDDSTGSGGSTSERADETHLHASHEAIQRQLAARKAPGGSRPPADARFMTPHPPAGSAQGPQRRARGETAPRHQHEPHAEQYGYAPAASSSVHFHAAGGGPSASAAPAPAHDALPYHRKRLLELVDPATYSDVLADTARQLGVDLTLHPSKRWVVEALFLAPLPQQIVRCFDQHGHAYYHDKRLGTSSWTHPCAKQFETLLAAQEHKEAEAKSNDDVPREPTPPTPPPVNNDDTASNTNEHAPAAASGHTRRFLRANAGLSSTSSLFLSEAELAAWGDADEEDDRRDDRDDDRDEERGDAWIHDEFGGLDGERWSGENGELPGFDESTRAPSRASRAYSYSSSRPRSVLRSSGARSRGVGGVTYPLPVLPPTVTNPIPWNSAQPPLFHPFKNPAGVADTERAVIPLGSLIDERVRPASGVRRMPTRPLSGLANGDAMTPHAQASRAAHSAAIRDGQKRTRARINGRLRETSGHLYTIRQTLLTKLAALERTRTRVLREDERAWVALLRSVETCAQVAHERQGMFQLAAPMLDAADASALEETLVRTQEEADASATRIRGHVDACRALAAHLASLSAALEQQVAQAQEVLRMDAACLELSRTGVLPVEGTPRDVAAPPPTTSLREIQHLLDAVLDVQSRARLAHAASSRQQVAEKDLAEHLVRTNALMLRRGAQHCAERKARINAEALANRTQIPALHNQAKALRASLQAQTGPLAVCQQTYELRVGAGVSASAVGGEPEDEHGELVRALEDELSALTTLVAHLESELSLTQGQLATCQETARLHQADLATEDVRLKFYRGMMSVANANDKDTAPAQAYAQLPHAYHEDAEPQGQHRIGGHSRRHRSASAVDDASLYRTDPAHVGTYMHSYNPAEQSPNGVPPHGHEEHTYPLVGVESASDPSRSLSTGPPLVGAYGSALGGSGRARRASARPQSAAQVHALETTLRHERNQLVRDQASNQERLRTRKVRRAKVTSGAALKPELLIPNAGRPVFEGVHSTGYDS